MKFENKTILVTGAAGNLGRAVASKFAADGANLVLVGSTAESLDKAFPDDKPGVSKVAVDLLDRDAVAAAVQPFVDAPGGIDMLCACAGGFHMGEPVCETPVDKWNLMMDLNTRTLLNIVSAVTPGMIARGSGKIVTIGASSALHGVPQMGAYTASKSVVLRLTEAMSGELRGKGINVNCVMPSIIDTPENRSAMPDANPAKWVAPDDLASVVSFLCSDDAKAINGALIPVVGLS